MAILKKIFITFIILCSVNVYAVRIKDIASIQGVRSNYLMGYGLVVGLNGTGDNEQFTQQSFTTMLNRLGIKLPVGFKPKIKNVAAVIVNADLPAFVKNGQTIDVTVSSVGNAKSLRGGTLLFTPLKGADARVYAVSQGNLVVGGLDASGSDGSRITVNVPVVGRIPNGAIVERTVATGFENGSDIMLNIHQPDFTTAIRVADTINQFLGPHSAKAIDPASIQVNVPFEQDNRMQFLSQIENLDLTPGQASAKIIVNSRTGTIVIGQQVRLSPAAVTHGNLTVTITETEKVSQPAPLGEGQTVVTPETEIQVTRDNNRMFVLNPGVSLENLVRAVNQVGAAPGDLMAILEALKQAGALHASLEII